jgi:hypothetical protein
MKLAFQGGGAWAGPQQFFFSPAPKPTTTTPHRIRRKKKEGGGERERERGEQGASSNEEEGAAIMAIAKKKRKKKSQMGQKANRATRPARQTWPGGFARLLIIYHCVSQHYNSHSYMAVCFHSFVVFKMLKQL